MQNSFFVYYSFFKMRWNYIICSGFLVLFYLYNCFSQFLFVVYMRSLKEDIISTWSEAFLIIIFIYWCSPNRSAVGEFFDAREYVANWDLWAGNVKQKNLVCSKNSLRFFCFIRAVLLSECTKWMFYCFFFVQTCFEVDGVPQHYILIQYFSKHFLFKMFLHYVCMYLKITACKHAFVLDIFTNLF